MSGNLSFKVGLVALIIGLALFKMPILSFVALLFALAVL